MPRADRQRIVRIQEASCTCGVTSKYTLSDALADEMFTVKNTRYDFRLMVRYDFEMAHCGSTFDAAYNTQRRLYELHSQRFVKKDVFIDVWWQWNRARKLDFDTIFDCPLCKSLPPDLRAWILDVTRLGIKRDRFATVPCDGCEENPSTMTGW